MIHLHIAFDFSRFVRVSGFVLALASMPAISASAQDKTSPLDEKALAVLKQMSDYIGTAKTLSFRSRAFFDVVRESGIKIKSGRASKVLIKRPNQLFVEAVEDDGGARTAWFEGSKLTVWRRDANEVVRIDFSGSADAMLDHLMENYALQLPLADILYSDMNKTFRENLISAEYIGIRSVDGVNCHQLSFESKGADWQIWIEADATPVPRRFAIDFVTEENQPQFFAQMDAWSIDGEIEDFNFIAAVPKSVKEVKAKH